MIKEYPLRGKMINDYSLEELLSTKEKICRCGHTDLMHELMDKECRICTCPKYIFMKEVTLYESIKLLAHIEEKNKRYST